MSANSGGFQLKVFLAGRVTVETDGTVIDERRFPGRQGRLLFAYLVAEQGRPVPRDELAEALWETPPATWEKVLTVTVSKLRSLLTELGVDGASALTGAFGCYRLALPEGTWVDVIVATEATRDAERALAASDLDEAKAAAATAASLVGQPFLPGEDGAWVEGKRRELAIVHGRALTVLADASLGLGDAIEAATWAEQVIALEPFRETGYRRLMEAHVAAGNRAEALQVYERCRRLLAEELGAYPSPETESVYRGLLDAPTPRNGGAAASAVDIEHEPAQASVRRPSRRARVATTGVAVAVAAVVAAFLFAFDHSNTEGSPGTARLGATVRAFDSTNGRPRGSIELAGSPGSIAYGEGSVWVAMAEENTVARIDPTTDTLQQTIAVAGSPSAIAVGDGFVWVADSLTGTVSEIDPRKNGGQEVARIPVGNGPTGVAYGLGAVWVADSVDGTVVRVDPAAGKADRRISVEGGADAVAVGDRAVWVTGKSAGILSRVDPRAGSAAQPINVGTAPVALVTGAGAVWVVNSGDGTVSRIDSATNRVTATHQVGEGPSGVAVTPGGRSVWVSNELDGTLTEIDPTLDTVVKTITVGGLPQGVATSGSTTYVAVKNSGAAHRGGTLTLAVPNPQGVYEVRLPRSLDPAYGSTAWELLPLTNDGLVGLGRSGGTNSSRIVPDLAVALPTISDGGRTYTFHLRTGIRYSTGALVGPMDIRRGIERSLLATGREAPSALLTGIVGARACVMTPTHCDLSKGIVPNTRFDTLTFHLTAPDPDFLYKLALPIAYAVPPSTPLKAPIPLPATGPYEIGAYNAKHGVVQLVRNPRFHPWSAAAQPDGFPDRIVERYGYTGKSAVRAVERGTADVTAEGFDLTWPVAVADLLRRQYSSRLYETPIPAPVGVWLNTRTPPFDDIRVRRALNYAVDRNHLIGLAGGPGVAETGCQMLPPNIDGYRRYCPYTSHRTATGSYNGPDLAKARRLVLASGTKGQAVSVWFYTTRTGKVNGPYFVSLLKSLGYRAHLRTVPHTQSTWRLHRQAGVGGWGPIYPSANSVFSPQFTCRSYDPAHPDANPNPAGFCDRQIDAEIARADALQLTDRTAASKLWTAIDRQITDQAPWILIRLPLDPDFVSNRTGNWTYCYLSALTGSTGACLDQLWVR